MRRTQVKLEQKNICPYCESEEQWYMHTTGEENVFQCSECMRYFKVKVTSIQPAETKMI
jgi:transcription elongation factor Elf1